LVEKIFGKNYWLKRFLGKILIRLFREKMSLLLPSSKSKSGYKYIIFDGRAAAKKKPWSVSTGSYRSKGFCTAEQAAEHYSKTFHPDWWEKPNVRISDTELVRMSLFGIRLKMKLKKEYKRGTVVAYYPATHEHVIRFDDKDTLFNFRLTRENNWERIAWDGNVLDSSQVGESNGSNNHDSYLSFGPDCPKCAAFLGVGVKAWSVCNMCGHNEPGACVWGASSA
jgi:hypothetical protein